LLSGPRPGTYRGPDGGPGAGDGTRATQNGGVVVEVDVPGEDVELAVDALFGLGATAVSEQADGAVVTLTADLPDGAHLDGLRWPARTVVPAAPAAPPPPPPTRVGRVVVHHPDHPVAPPDGGVAVAIDPEGAFGHGAHPT